jgi:hypothetical protein
MNIFYFDSDIELNAQYHCDRHCIKMILEQSQLLCSAHWLNNSQAPYKLTHKNHPCSIWTRASLSNYIWLVKMTKALCKEYTYRYGRRHKTEDIVDWCSSNLPPIEDIGLTERPQCMDEQYKRDSVVESYREYYRSGKAHLHSWKSRDIPSWI